MKTRHVQCPVCGAVLRVPPGCANCFVRCGACRFRFRLPRHIAVTDEAIAEWLWQASPQKVEETEEEEVPEVPVPEAPPSDGEPVSGKTAVLPALSDQIQLVRVDDDGALFEFPAKRLTETEFRCSLPRRCLRCGTRLHLEAHVIVFTQELRDSFALESESPDELSLGERIAMALEGQDLLNALPQVPNVPPPGNLPTPYWVCDMCSASGLISGQIQMNPETGMGTCRLLIRNLHRAQEFFRAAGGEGSEEYERFQRHVAGVEVRPWDTLPELIQERLGDWYHPQEGEQLIAYIPDRDLVRTEDGGSGIVVSDRRFICHSQGQHLEAGIEDPLRLEMPPSTGRLTLRIKASSWELRSFSVDRRGADLLRRVLSSARFNAVWY